MSGASVRRWLLAAAAGLLAAATPAVPQPGPRAAAAPRLEAVAETRLLMEGLTRANFQGLGRLLKDRPEGADAWAFARGQALLIGEAGNLLMLRPPRSGGQEAWLGRSAELREAATRLARAAAARDYDRCRKGLDDLAAVCNRCHQTFRVPVKVTPFEDRAGR
jgi:cytochrome c556